MTEQPVLKATRKELYDEIWKISVAGLARKYDIPYTHMLKQIKEVSIPVPPSGYWGLKEPTERAELTGAADEIVLIHKTASSASSRKPRTAKHMDSSPKNEKPVAKKKGRPANVPIIQPKETFQEHPEPETREHYRQIFNVYDRETLYDEVWERPVIEVAKRYKVSDVAIHKVCKSLSIPTPPAGYWAKARAGKPVKKIPLPQGDYPKQKEGLRPGTATYKTTSTEETLAFMNEENRAIILAVAGQILLPNHSAQMHAKIIAHRRRVTEWLNQLQQNRKKGWGNRNMSAAPFLAETIAESTLPRVCHIFDALIRAMEPLGCKLTDNLDFIISGERVPIFITEATDKVAHVPTKEENIQLIEYEERRRKNPDTYKPNIRKYDHQYNGRICFSVYNKKSFRDCKSYCIEDKLGDIMIELYESSEIIRREREAYEEKERQREEESRRKEERRKRYNLEVEHTNALVNAADDYAIAHKIRAYVAAVEMTENISDETREWVEWAKQKADWYDPSIAREDDFFGLREHEKGGNYKELKESYSSWGW